MNDNLSLSQIKQALGEKGIFTVKALLNLLVGDLVLFLNVGKSMTKSQIVATVDLILQEYPYFKPEDFKLCFNRAKKGDYGTIFDRIDGQIILTWLGQYDNERTAEIEDLWQTANSQLKKREAEPLLTTDEKANAEKNQLFKENIAKLLAAGEERKKSKLQAETERKNAKFEKGAIYDMHQRWINQFDKLWVKQGCNSKRIVRKYGKMKNPFYFDGSTHKKYVPRQLDINQYLEYKQSQYNTFVLQANKYHHDA